MHIEKDPKPHGSGVLDPTPYKAIKELSLEEKRVSKLLKTIFYITDLAGFRIRNRIELVDKKTGNVYE